MSFGEAHPGSFGAGAQCRGDSSGSPRIERSHGTGNAEGGRRDAPVVIRGVQNMACCDMLHGFVFHDHQEVGICSIM